MNLRDIQIEFSRFLSLVFTKLRARANYYALCLTPENLNCETLMLVRNVDPELPLTGNWHWPRPLRIFSGVESDENFVGFTEYFSQ